jgi:hypothetical protein
MAWDDHAGIDKGTAIPIGPAALDERNAMTPAGAAIGDAQPDDSGADDEYAFAHACGLMPQHNGSASSKSSVASSVTYADPVM